MTILKVGRLTRPGFNQPIFRALFFILAAIFVNTSFVQQSFAEEKLSKSYRKLLAMTPTDFQQKASIKDDSLETIAQISTEPGFKEKQGLLRIIWDDNFLRAFIDKETGTTYFQVYQYISYQGDWRFYHTVNFETLAGPKSAEVDVIKREVESCSGSDGCILGEHLGFEVSGELLQSIASVYNPGSTSAWLFKFKSKSGKEFKTGIVPAEVIGFLAAVDDYRAKLGFGPTGLLPSPPEQTYADGALAPQN